MVTYDRLRSGVLAGQLDGFAAWLWDCGYSPATGLPYLSQGAQLSGEQIERAAQLPGDRLA
jgi:hypothetical protein